LRTTVPPNPPFQPTAARTRSLFFETLAVARLQRLNGKPLDGSHHSFTSFQPPDIVLQSNDRAAERFATF
jgi:hypothetical protein